MKLIVFLHIGLLLNFHYTLYAQENEDARLFAYGLKAGVTRSSISNLETTILSEPYFLNYTLNPQTTIGWAGGGFLIYRFYSPVSLHAEIMYSQQGSDLVFNNIEKDFNYKMQFGYQYLNVLALVKLYPFSSRHDEREWRGPNVSAGPQVGFNVTPQNIKYTSGGSGRLAAFGSDLEQQQQLRNVLKGKNDFGFVCGLGYEFRKFGLTVDARYQLTLTDAVETQANSYNFIENKNTKTSFQFSIGWDFSFFK